MRFSKQLFHVAAILLVVGVLMSVTPAEASHFRFGHITWKPRPDISPTTAELDVKLAYRRSFYGAPNVGDSVFLESLFFGDGGGISPAFTILSIDPVNDWLLGEVTGIIHTYPAVNNGGSPWIARVDSCCRIGGNQNAPSTSYRVQTTVDLGVPGGDASPRSTTVPILNMAVNAVNNITVPVGDADGDDIACRLATGAESGIFTQPGPPAGGALNALTVAVGPGGCVLTWDTTGTSIGQLYATQIVIEESRGGNPSHGRAGLEFLIRIVGDIGTAPVCDTPPTPSGNITVNVGQVFNATIQGSDVDAGDTLVLNTAGIPGGATLAPGLPTVGGSPISTVLSWTPTLADIGPQPFVFTVTDSNGLQDVCSFTLDVVDQFDPFGGIVRTPTRRPRLTLDRPTPDTDGVRCVDASDDPDNPDFTGVPFVPFDTDPVEFDIDLSKGDGTKTVCCEFIDNQGVISGPQCADIELELECNPDPHTQGYWHRQCLGAQLITPGRGNGRGPQEPTEPDFVKDYIPAVNGLLEANVFEFLTCEDGMLASPASDKCEKALKQYTALLLNGNLASERLQDSCVIDLAAEGCTSTTIGELIDELAALINTEDPDACKIASDCAATANEGNAVVESAVVNLAAPVATGQVTTVSAAPREAAPVEETPEVVTRIEERPVLAPVVVADSTQESELEETSEEPRPADDERSIQRHLAVLANSAASEDARKVSIDALLTAVSGGYEPEVRLEIVAALVDHVDTALHSLLVLHLEDIRDEARDFEKNDLAEKAEALLKHLEASME